VALTQGHKEEWTSLYIVGLFAISAIAFCLFVVIELTVDDPIVDLRLYRHLSFTMGCLLGFLNTLVFRGSGFLMSVFVQYTLQYSPIQAGYMNAPSGLAFGSMSYLSGRLSDRFGPRLPIALGMVLFIFTFFWYADMNRWSTTFVILQVMMLRPFAYGWTNSPTNFAAIHALPEHSVRMGSGLFSLVRGIASSFGVAMGATLLDRQTQVHVLQFVEDAGYAVTGLGETLTALQEHVAAFGGSVALQPLQALAMLGQYMREEAVFAAYQDIFMLGGILSVVSILPIFLLRSRRRAPAPTPVDTPPTAVVSPHRDA
jgi:predicted MFS family arabinose efflux permease